MSHEYRRNPTSTVGIKPALPTEEGVGDEVGANPLVPRTYVFSVQCHIGRLMFTGTGRSKQQAKHSAALLALQSLPGAWDEVERVHSNPVVKVRFG